MADYTPRMKQRYDDQIVKAMTEKFGYKNALEVPKLEKITLNMGVGEASQDKKKVQTAAEEMALIAGQKPVITKAKKSIAQFKLREGMPIGCKVTLRRERMYEFMDRLVTVAMPRIRDFRGLNPKSFDGRGNYAMGLKEQIIFPEISYDQIDKVSCSVSRSRLKSRKRRRRREPLIEELKSNGETEFDQQERASQEARQAVCGKVREAEGYR